MDYFSAEEERTSPTQPLSDSPAVEGILVEQSSVGESKNTNPFPVLVQQRRTIPTPVAILIGFVAAALFFGLGFAASGHFFTQNTVYVPSSSSLSSSTSLQQGANPGVTVPPLSSNNSDAVREAVIAKVSPAIVEVDTFTASGGAIGSGIIVDARGYVVTNAHVVVGAQSVNVILSDSSKFTAQVLATDTSDDLAVLKFTPAKTPVVATLGDSAQLKVGQSVVAIGNPLGDTQTVTSGIVSALGRTVNESQTSNAAIRDAIQTDAPINPGNSGGALVDLQGNVIGMPTLSAIDPEFNTPANGVGFAIPSNRINFIVTQVIQTGSISHTGRAELGVSISTVDSLVASQYGLAVNHGVLIQQVTANGPAAQAGLKAGDVVIGINGAPVTDQTTLQDILVNLSPGQKVPVQIYRGSQQMSITVTLGELPAVS